MGSRTLQIRGNLGEALQGRLHAGGRGGSGRSGQARRRPKGADGRPDGAANGTGSKQAADCLSRSGGSHPADPDQGWRTPETGRSPAARSRQTFGASGFRAPAPPHRPNAPVEKSIRNVAYALLSGADGWMFDGEDALGQLSTMSLDNQRNLTLAIHRDPMFMKAAEEVAAEMNQWARDFFGRPIIDDWMKQLDFTTKIFRARGLHLDDRQVRHAGGAGFSASIVDTTLYIVNNHRQLRRSGASLVLYLPKIQTAEEAAFWSDMLEALEHHLGLPAGTIKVYVLVEQIEACFQLMEIRAALGTHFVGFNTGRWDYINSVSDAMAWDERVRQSEHRRHHDDVRLHAELRGPRAARREHAGPAGAVRPLAGRDGAEHSGRIGSRRDERDEESHRRRRTRATRGRERQMGRPLEDGAHRQAGVGKGRRGQPARTEIPAAHLHAGRRRRSHPDRTGAANRFEAPGIS